MDKARLAAIRAALDATGLRGCDVSPGNPTVITVPECAGCYEVFGAALPADIGGALAALVRKVTTRADAALRALGLPGVVGVRSLAAENAALQAEVARLRAMLSGARWYSYDPEERHTEHGTEAEARAAAEVSLDYYRDEATGDGWHMDVHAVEFGMLIPVAWAVETDRVETPDGPHNCTCDYVLSKVPRG